MFANFLIVYNSVYYMYEGNLNTLCLVCAIRIKNMCLHQSVFWNKHSFWYIAEPLKNSLSCPEMEYKFTWKSDYYTDR